MLFIFRQERFLLGAIFRDALVLAKLGIIRQPSVALTHLTAKVVVALVPSLFLVPPARDRTK